MITHECIITKASCRVWPGSDNIDIQAEENEDETVKEWNYYSKLYLMPRGKVVLFSRIRMVTVTI